MNLDYIFHPRSIAVIGASDDLRRHNDGRNYFKTLSESGFKGQVYAINSSGREVSGIKAYSNIKEIPGAVDYVIFAIPARLTIQLMKDCAAKGVKVVHLYTSGFREVENEQGKALEIEVLRVARQYGIRVIGPNCMGVYCPDSGLTFAMTVPGQSGFPRQSGPFAFISQSGGNSIYCIHEAETRSMYFSKVVSYGNGADLNESDFIEYLAHDPQTGIIGAYIEGVRDGARFMKVLKAAAALKPIIICKAGGTDSGARLAASHTGSLAGSDQVWRTLLKQAGAIQVETIDEVNDIAQLFLRMPVPKGRRVAVVGSGGGPSVQAADDCARAGLSVPLLPDSVRQGLRQICGGEAGYIFTNPVDMAMTSSDTLPKAIRMIVDCGQIDLLLMHIAFDGWALINKRSIIEPVVESCLRLKGEINKPTAIILHSQATNEARELASAAQQALCQAGFAVFPSLKRAVVAIDRYIRYYERGYK